MTPMVIVFIVIVFVYIIFCFYDRIWKKHMIKKHGADVYKYFFESHEEKVNSDD